MNGVAVAVLALDPGPAPLERLLLARAVGWARSVTNGRALVACASHDAAGVRDAVGRGVALTEVDDDSVLAHAAAVLSALEVQRDEPCLLLWPRLGRPDGTLAASALDDLRSGCELVIGPVFDGGLYLLGMRGGLDLIAAVPEGAWNSGELIGAVVAAAAERGLDVGLLRTERGLRRPADVRAALADPLLDDELRAVLAA